MWRLGQVQRFLDASALIVSSPAFCMRGDDNWEGLGHHVLPLGVRMGGKAIKEMKRGNFQV
jgi:hypothetical protein